MTVQQLTSVGSEVKASACNAGDLGSIPGSGRSPGEGNGNPHQYSCLENPMDGGAWWATVYGVAKSWTRQSDFTFTHVYNHLFHCSNFAHTFRSLKNMKTHMLYFHFLCFCLSTLLCINPSSELYNSPLP